MFKPLDKFGHQIQEVVMPLIVVKDKQMYPVGTCFVVSGDGLIMTAGHVVDEIAKISGVSEQNLLENKDLSNINLYALYIKGEKHGGLWPIDRLWSSPNIDIAFGWMKSAYMSSERIMHKQVKLDPTPPPIGTKIAAVGYYAMAGSMGEVNERNEIIVDYRQDTAVSDGEVEEIFSSGRDGYLLTWPSFQTNARFDPGMSGGPVFDGRTGNVCGVVCTGFSTNDTSYASIIWPSMGILVDVRLQEGVDSGYYPALDLVEKGKINLNKDQGSINVVDTGDKRNVCFVPVS